MRAGARPLAVAGCDSGAGRSGLAALRFSASARCWSWRPVHGRRVAAPPTADVRLLSPSPAALDGPPPVTVAHGADAALGTTRPSLSPSPPTSAVSTVAATFVQVDGAEAGGHHEVVVKAPRTHAGDGAHVLTFWSVDADGRTETPQTVVVKVDTRPPTSAGLKLRPDVLHRVQPFGSASRSPTSPAAPASPTGRRPVRLPRAAGPRHRRRHGHDRSRDPGPLRQRQGLVPGLLPHHAHLRGPAPAMHVSPKPLLLRDYHPAHASVTYRREGRGKARRAHL